MKIVIFAGGVGTRLWPLSRKNSPKQFEKIFGEKSTLQETIDRLLPSFSPSDIYIATGARYEKIVREQLTQLPPENFIFEPEMRDVGPAIGLVSAILAKHFSEEPVAILWSDHLVKQEEKFRKMLRKAEEMIKSKKSEFVFVAQRARFASQNMGWIKVGEHIEKNEDVDTYLFQRLCYRPTLEQAQEFFEDKNYVWNLGYFVTTPKTLLSLYERFLPQMYTQLLEIQKAYGSENYTEVSNKIYPLLEKISFDDAILVKLQSDSLHVLSSDLGWSDVGAWEALKEALSESEDDNVTKGNVTLEDATDTLVFNYTDQMIVGIDLHEMLVVNTGDVLLVCPKTSVPKIKKLVENLAGTPHEHLT